MEEITGLCALSLKHPRGIKDASLGVLLPMQFLLRVKPKPEKVVLGVQELKVFFQSSSSQPRNSSDSSV